MTYRQDTLDSPVVQTTAGKVRGALREGVYSFKGIPYGDSTGSSHRFRAPAKTTPWVGVRDALNYGPIAMQQVLTQGEVATYSDYFAFYEGNMLAFNREPSEDCLVLNVWSSGLGNADKRPVMVWCHGGGFTSGMGEADWHDGANLARKHDVVVVHFNHRLNVFGFLFLGDLGGPEFADSGNAGMLDIVAALRWVHDNIAQFGGDPENVTIFGESGGGFKVSTLMAMPLAKGLFHKAIVQSGSGCRALTIEEAAQTTRELLGELNIDFFRIEKLQQVPARELSEAMRRVMTAVSAGRSYLAGERKFWPVVDGRSLPRHPFHPDGPAISADVPMLIGTNKDEMRSLALTDPGYHSLNETATLASIQQFDIGEAQANGLVRAYRATRPTASPSDIGLAVMTDRVYRHDAILQAERKSAQGGALAYMYLFSWEASGRYGSCHGVEVPFVFDNLDRAPGLKQHSADPRDYELADTLAKSWVAFARTGNPNHSGLPVWRPYRIAERATMVFDYTCGLVNDPLSEDRVAMQPLSFGPLNSSQ